MAWVTHIGPAVVSGKIYGVSGLPLPLPPMPSSRRSCKESKLTLSTSSLRKLWSSGPDCLDSSSGLATHSLCDLRQITMLLCASMVSPVKWGSQWPPVPRDP